MTWFASLGDKQIVTGRVTVPRFGTWSGDLVLAKDAVVTGSTSLVLGDLTMKAFARPARSGKFAGKAASRVVGGNGGLNRVLDPKGYSHAAGVKLSVVLKDAARSSGEEINVATDRTIGIRWTRKSMRASSVLRLLLDGEWWMNAAGVMQTGARTSTAIASPFQVIDYKPQLGLFEIATEKYADWTPGRTFSAPTLSGSFAISSVSFVIADGKIRLQVTTSTTAEQRLIQDVRAIIRDEVLRYDFGSFVPYKITRAAEQEIDCKPIGGTTKWPALAKVPLSSGLLGETVTPTVGKSCVIFFLDHDPSQYRCVGVEGPNQEAAFEVSGDLNMTAGSNVVIDAGSNVEISGGSNVEIDAGTTFTATGGSGELELTSAAATLKAVLVNLNDGGTGVVTQASLAPIITSFLAYLTAAQAFYNGPIAALSGGTASPAAAAAAALAVTLALPHYSLTVKAAG